MSTIKIKETPYRSLLRSINASLSTAPVEVPSVYEGELITVIEPEGYRTTIDGRVFFFGSLEEGTDFFGDDFLNSLR